MRSEVAVASLASPFVSSAKTLRVDMLVDIASRLTDPHDAMRLAVQIELDNAHVRLLTYVLY